jgi:hypothetical protein
MPPSFKESASSRESKYVDIACVIPIYFIHFELVIRSSAFLNIILGTKPPWWHKCMLALATISTSLLKLIRTKQTKGVKRLKMKMGK